MKKFYLLLTLLLIAFVGRATEVTWTKVTDASVLKAGDKVIIVCETKKVAMSTTQNDNNRGKTDYTTIEDAIPETGDIQVVTLEDAGTTGSVKRFAFNTGDGYLYSASSSSNYLKTREANNDDNGIWTISIDESGNATIKSQGSNTRNTIKYNSSSTIFSSYSSGQTAVQLYYSPAQAATTCATPTFSVAGGTFYGNAGETLDVALSCATEGATIKYTVNGKEQTNNGTNILNLVYPGTYEVAAWATADGHETSATATATYKLVDKATLTKFTKVTDASVLKAGDKVIIVCETKKVAMSTTQNDNNRGKTDYTTIEDAIPETGDIQVVTLEDAGTTGSVKRFAFNTGDGYLYSASSSSNYLKTREANNDDNGIWTISIDESGNATIKSQGSNTRNTIKYNSSSTIFSSYSSGQSAVQLYYSPAPAATTCAAPKFFEAEGTYYGFNEQTKEITLSCSTKDATIMYSINGGEEQAYEAPITITCPSTTTISAYAMKANSSLGNSATVSKTYNYEVYPSVASIADFKTKGAADAAADATKPYMFTCPLTVTYQNSNRLYLRDEAGDAILVYGTIDKAYTAGNQLPANTVVGTYTNYHQMAEIIPVADVEWPTTETNADASPVEMTIDQLNAVTEAEWSTIASKLVVIKGAKVSADGSTITVGDAKLANVYAKRFNPTLENASAVYDVVGIIETHWTNNIVDGIQFCQTAYLDNYSPEKMYMIGYIQSINQDWHATQGIEMAKEAAGRYSADVNLSFNDWFAVTSHIAEYDDEGGWAWVNGDRYAYTSGVFGKVATDYVMTQGDVKTQVFWAGNFKVTVDYYAKTISFVPAAVNADGTPDYSTVFPEKLRIVGEIADGEWAAESIVENHLATRGEDGYTYTFNELQFVKTGKFRLTTAWDATNWDGSYSVNGRALKAATDAEPRINFGTVANILPFTSNDLVADVQKYGGYDFDFANLQLIVNLKDMTVTGTMSSGVSQIKVGNATVTATNGTIRVDGGNTTSIYNIAGQAIALGSKAKEFNVARGMYIVNVDGKATKVVVR